MDITLLYGHPLRVECICASYFQLPQTLAPIVNTSRTASLLDMRPGERAGCQRRGPERRESERECLHGSWLRARPRRCRAPRAPRRQQQPFDERAVLVASRVSDGRRPRGALRVISRLGIGMWAARRCQLCGGKRVAGVAAHGDVGRELSTILLFPFEVPPPQAGAVATSTLASVSWPPEALRRLHSAINVFWVSRNEWCIHSAEERAIWRLHEHCSVETTASPTREGNQTTISRHQENTTRRPAAGARAPPARRQARARSPNRTLSRAGTCGEPLGPAHP